MPVMRMMMALHHLCYTLTPPEASTTTVGKKGTCQACAWGETCVHGVLILLIPYHITLPPLVLHNT